MCVKPKGAQRPPISEVLKEIQDAIAIERGPQEMQRSTIQQQLLVSNNNRSMGGASSPANNNSGSVAVDLEQNGASFDELLMRPGLRWDENIAAVLSFICMYVLYCTVPMYVWVASLKSEIKVSFM